LNPQLKDWQGDCVRYLLRRGAGAAFEECGLGKTFQQLEWAYHVAAHTRGLVLVLCPLAVAEQTKREAERFNIGRDGQCPVIVAKAQDAIPFTSGIVITNYEKLAKFDTGKFTGVVLDESSILKSFNGKTKQALCNSFASTPDKLACTATPAPNDQLELGNHSEFLGVLRQVEMIGKYFVNESGDNKSYRLRKHAVEHFWDWVSSWAVSLESPADLGYSADGYVLPELVIHEHEVDTDYLPASKGQLFCNEGISATSVHKEKRLSCGARSEVVAGLVNNSTDSWVVWCDTDYEADELVKRIPDAVEVRGSFTDSKKIQAIDQFSLGIARVIVCKPEACGFGLNWQHCSHTAFVGVSYSFERFYQAIRRMWRFGQLNPVHAHVVNSLAEHVIWRTVKRKEEEHRQMKTSMSGVMLTSQMQRVRGKTKVEPYRPAAKIVLPDFLKARV
jgi:superfamily II DNA or RNA helicase